MTDIDTEVREVGLSTIAPTRLSDVGPVRMVEMASELATVLKSIVDRQKLYAMISGRKYPTVEAWMTIGRMDNTVAQEEAVTRQEDGSYIAVAILVRLSDGSIVGRASALCGAPDDHPWDKRPEFNRRSMAVTRAISRAFRAQYSWIMSLAGYEPTPAEEMPRDRDEQPAPAGVKVTTAPVVSEADAASLAPDRFVVLPEGVSPTQYATIKEGVESDGPMTLTELQRRAGQLVSISALNAKSKDLFGTTINHISDGQRQQVAEEMGLA